MTLPHIFFLIFFGIWSGILTFISFWIILFTGRYPESFFEYQVKLTRWNVRLSARRSNLTDGYPAFFIDGTDDLTSFDLQYPESMSRGNALLKALLGWLYCAFPHAFVLFFRFVWGGILSFVAWWVILFTGKYPVRIHAYNVGTIRWTTRLNLYLTYMTEEYPPFSGRE